MIGSVGSDANAAYIQQLLAQIQADAASAEDAQKQANAQVDAQNS